LPKSLKPVNRKDETILQGSFYDADLENGKNYGPAKIKILHKWEGKDSLQSHPISRMFDAYG